MSQLPTFIDTSHHSNIPNINLYDRNGRVNFDYEAVKGTLLEAFDILKKKGVSGVQFQSKLQFDPLNRDYIVVHAGEGDDDTVVDLGFTYNSDTQMIDVMKFSSNKRVEYKDEKGNDVTTTARNYWSDWGQILYVNNPNSDGHNMGDILVAPVVNGQPNLTDCSPTNNTVFARTYDLNVGGWGSLGIKADASKPFTIEECKKIYAVPKVVDIMHSFQPVLDELRVESHLLPKMKCEYYDLEEQNTVWFEPVGEINVSYLYKDFYCGVVKTNNSFLVDFRNVIGDGSDIEIEVAPTLDSVKKCISDVIGTIKRDYWTYRKTYEYIVSTYGNKSLETTGEEMDDGHCIGQDGYYEGRYIGLNDNILKHMHATDKETDAYLAVRLEYDNPSTSKNEFTKHINIWIQGEAADNVSEKLGKNLQCRAVTLSDIKKQVDAMMSAIKNL